MPDVDAAEIALTYWSVESTSPDDWSSDFKALDITDESVIGSTEIN